jgi:alpha-soluble NSF attachment protein
MGDGKGDMLVREAEKKLKGGFLSNLMGGSSQRYEDAADLYIKAGNAYKLSKQWEEGAEAFRKAAGCYMHAQSGHEAATAYISASNCIKKANPRGTPSQFHHPPRARNQFIKIQFSN